VACPPAYPICRPFTQPYDRAELLADAVMHAAGLSFAIGGIIFLTWRAGALQGLQSASVWIYGLGLVTMFVTSAAYSLWPLSRAKLLLRRFDQSAIFLFIAASYTPLIANARGDLNEALLAAIWLMAWIGVVAKLGCPGRFERLTIVLCFLLGWSGLFAYHALFGWLPPSTIFLIVSGGALYSMGVIFHLWDQLRFQNALWHACVVGGSVLQFCAISNVVAVAAP
jgi:hemolysin III